MGGQNIGVRARAGVDVSLGHGSVHRALSGPEVRAQSALPLWFLACPQQPPQGRSLSLQPGRAPRTLTHCGRRLRGPGSPRTPSSRYASCLGSTSVLGAGPAGPGEMRRGRPEAVGCPASCPPGRGSCGRVEHLLQGGHHSQGEVVHPRAAHTVPALRGREPGHPEVPATSHLPPPTLWGPWRARLDSTSSTSWPLRISGRLLQKHGLRSQGDP